MATSYEYLQLLASKVTNELVIAGVGRVAREWYHLKPGDGNLHPAFMCAATPIALGIAIALPHRRVISLDTDGNMLMDLTVLPVIAQQNPANLVVIVFDNELYEAAGNVPTFTAGTTDLVKIAQGAGIRSVRLVNELSEFQEAIDKAFQASSASFITAKVQMPSEPKPYPPVTMDDIENKYRFIRYIEKTENIKIIK